MSSILLFQCHRKKSHHPQTIPSQSRRSSYDSNRLCSSPEDCPDCLSTSETSNRAEVLETTKIVYDPGQSSHINVTGQHVKDCTDVKTLSWQIPINEQRVVQLTLCLNTYRISCDGAQVANIPVDIEYMSAGGYHESDLDFHRGLLRFRIPIPSTDKQVNLTAVFKSRMDMRNVANTGSPKFLTQLAHLTSSMGLKVDGWRIDH